MKKIFAHFCILLSVALLGALSACTPKELIAADDAGLGIKTFFPTKVVTNQPMTINGTGLSDVREVVFPGGVSVTDIEHVGYGMIRLTAPAGIAADGGKLIVRTSDEEAESRQTLTLGHTVVSGFSGFTKQDDEEIGHINGGDQLSVYGTDLEFICRAELLDPDGNPLILEDEEFYRKGTSTVVITIPKKIFDGTWIGKLYTFDGQEIPLPELEYKSASDGGHWEEVDTVIWENGDGSAVAWSGKYRFALEGHDGANECIAEFSQDVWDRLMTETFYLDVSATDPQIRFTNGYWDSQWTPGDFKPGNEKLTDNGDGTWTLEVNISDNPDYVATLVQKHLLITGDRFTPLRLYFKDQEWVPGGGHSEIVKVSIWKNDDPAGNGSINWSGKYRFAPESNSTGEEIYTVPQDVWDKMKAGPFYLQIQPNADWFNVRITNGWWQEDWNVGDIGANSERMIDNGDGTYYIEIDYSTDENFLGAVDAKHLLLTGEGYTPLELYFQEEIWVDDGGDSGPKEIVIWEGDGSAGSINWSGAYRFAPESNSTGEEIYTVPQDVWDQMKSGPFYVKIVPTADWFNVRVTNGWWQEDWNVGDIGANSERMIDNGDGTFHIEVDYSTDENFLGAVDAKHLLFTGEGYYPVKLYFLK